MKVKVGDKVYQCEPGQPLMVILTAQDRFNINHMHPNATRYAVFDDGDPSFQTDEEKFTWMDEGVINEI
ncbi:MAG: hypothetical protein GF334_01930 [Candidatus Altiarchaeales archaeon]|nr:hypothetical protein [Candidatus Altiarchaeales archaeon]